jgi:uncharacterized protein YkwD
MLLNVRSLRALASLFALCFIVTGRGQGVPSPAAQPPVIHNKKTSDSDFFAASAAAPAASGAYQFSIGNPTDEEQLYLELINRARADASVEAQRLIGLNDAFVQTALQDVNTNLMVSQFSTNPAAAPLSFNAKLSDAARSHTQYQFDNGIQTHVGPGTNTLRERLQAATYNFSWAAENVFTYAQSVQHGHAGFEIDWTGDTPNGGMQNPPGHRNNIHDRRFTEVGIGVLNGTNQVGTNVMVGPQLVTQDFGTPFPALTYITGVAYYDLNGNSFYDLGEGLSGVTVLVDGVDAFAVTTGSGGYSIPVTPGQTYTVHFQPAGVAETISSVSVPNTNNVKLDFRPVFNAPTVTDPPATTYAGISNIYHLSAFAGATAYRARVFNLTTPPIEGAEGPLTNVTLTTSAGYANISTSVKVSGANSFHLLHLTDSSTGVASPQLIQFANLFYVQPGGKIDFQSRLGISFGGTAATGPGEIARLEISVDEGKTWTSIWSQAGGQQDKGPDTSEKTFNARSVSLAGYAGKVVALRFNYDVNVQVGWFNETAAKYGWYIDDIAITNAQRADHESIATLDGSATFQFVPPTVGDYMMQFAAIAGIRTFPSGAWYTATAQPAPPQVSFAGNISISPSGISMNLVRISGTISSITVESASSLAGQWVTENGATISGPVNDQYTINLPANGSDRFYRARAN